MKIKNLPIKFSLTVVLIARRKSANRNARKRDGFVCDKNLIFSIILFSVNSVDKFILSIHLTVPKNIVKYQRNFIFRFVLFFFLGFEKKILLFNLSLSLLYRSIIIITFTPFHHLFSI